MVLFSQRCILIFLPSDAIVQASPLSLTQNGGKGENHAEQRKQDPQWPICWQALVVGSTGLVPLVNYWIHMGERGDVVSPGWCGFQRLSRSEPAMSTHCVSPVNTKPFFVYLFHSQIPQTFLALYLLRSFESSVSRASKVTGFPPGDFQTKLRL